MEIKEDEALLAPWYMHPSRVVYGGYLHPLLSSPHTYVDKLMNLHCNHPSNIFDSARVHSGIVKPKAIRISNRQPFLNPFYPDHQVTLTTDSEDHIKPYGFNVSVPFARHGVIAQPNALYSNIPYLFSCLSTFQHYHSRTAPDVENIFKDTLPGQIQFLNCMESSYPKEKGSTTRNIRANAAEASDLRLSRQADYFKNNNFHWQSERTNSTEAISDCSQVPFTLYANTSSRNAKVRESKKHQTCFQKFKHKALNKYRKHFMTPGNQNIIKKRQESPHPTMAKYTGKMKKHINKLKELSPKDSNRNAYTSVEIQTNDRKNQKESDKSSLGGFNNELRKKVMVNSDTQSPKENEPTNVVTNSVYHSAQTCITDDKKTFKCPQCRYLTDRKNNLKRHIMTMHQESSKSLECCGVSFQNKAALRDHNSIFHRGGYRCQICSRNFCRKALLRRHLTVHSGQKDFFCEICGYATSHKSNLERHQKVHTKREPTTGGLRKRGTAKESLQLGAASFLSRAILNSRAQSICYEVPDITSALPSYETASKSFRSDGALNQKSQYAAFIKDSPENYMNKLQILSGLKTSLHDNIPLNSYTKGNYDCDDTKINMKREDDEKPVPSIHVNTY